MSLKKDNLKQILKEFNKDSLKLLKDYFQVDSALLQ